jgi:hypothetical protein
MLFQTGVIHVHDEDDQTAAVPFSVEKLARLQLHLSTMMMTRPKLSFYDDDEETYLYLSTVMMTRQNLYFSTVMMTRREL